MVLDLERKKNKKKTKTKNVNLSSVHDLNTAVSTYRLLQQPTDKNLNQNFSPNSFLGGGGLKTKTLA